MSKRLSKNEIRRQRRKKKFKKRSEQTKAEAIIVSKRFTFDYAKLAFTYLFTGVIFFNFLASYPETPKAIADFEKGEPVKIAKKLASRLPIARSIKPAMQIEGLASESQINPLPEGPFDQQVLSIVKGTPMEKMVDDIAKRDRAVAAFIVGIAMKESKYGIYSPKKNGNDCYNYWGYRGRENPTKSGYSCFDSPSQAIEVVGNRIESFVNQGRTNPAKMVVWKCGYSCDAFEQEDVQKWISDVSINYYRLNSTK